MTLAVEVQKLSEQRRNALRLLEGDLGLRARALQRQIEEIDPNSSTRRQNERLRALCKKVERFYMVT